MRLPATSRHQRAASSLRCPRSLNLPPLKKRSRTYWTPRSTLGMSLGRRTRAGSVMKPRCWEYSRKPRVRRGCSASATATAAGKLLMTKYLGMPPKKAQAGDHLLQLLPVGGPQEAVSRAGQHHYQGPHRAVAARLLVWMKPRRPKSSSATSPGPLCSIRTVLALRCRQVSRCKKRRSDV